jgi:hypothetical protein
MISCIATNKNNDWYLINKCIAIKTGADASNQAIGNMLQLWIREWAFNKQVGMNYLQLLSPTGNVNEFNVFEFSIRKILAPYQGSVNWFNSHGNWNAYLKNNFSEEIYNAYQVSVQDIIIGYQDYKLTADVTIKYGNGLVTTLQVASPDNNQTNVQNTATSVLQKTNNTGIFINVFLSVKIFTGDNNPIPLGAICVRYVRPNEDVQWFYNHKAIYPASLKNNNTLLQAFDGRGFVPSEPFEEPTIICPLNCSVEVIGIV